MTENTTIDNTAENTTTVILTKEKKQRKPFVAFPLVKVFSFLGVLIFAAGVLLGIYAAVGIGEQGLYTTADPNKIIIEEFEHIATSNYYQVASYLMNDETDMADSFLENRNIMAMEIEKEGEDGKYYSFVYVRNGYENANLTEALLFNGKEGTSKWKIYVIPKLNECEDSYYNSNFRINLEYRFRYYVLAGIAVSAILFLVCATVFVCGIGVSYETGRVEESIFTKIPFDIAALLFIFAEVCLFSLMVSNLDAETAVVAGVLFVTLFLIALINFIHRAKLKNIFKSTLCYKIVVLFAKMNMKISVIWKAVLAFSVILFVELIGSLCIAGMVGEPAVVLLLFLAIIFEKSIIYPIALYIVLMIRQLFYAGEKLAEGDTDYKVNLAGFFGIYKKHAENLNNLSGVVNNAVEERLKSERMKTELITNVSHDLKTPLTSVINYSDLINAEAASYDGTQDPSESMEKISEYSEVLNRQSNKLKRLLDDLVEVSKASTGNMELVMEKLDVATIISQALGEYEERFIEKQLETITLIPEEDLYIKADSRKLWRVVDNLLQNIYKYSLPSTRVFIETKETDGKINIVFKNTSRDIITISPDELTERFTRNDESRHQEGNGLGLAIAKTMTEAMNGKFKIGVDGDLFKVTLTFDKESVPAVADAEAEIEAAAEADANL